MDVRLTEDLALSRPPHCAQALEHSFQIILGEIDVGRHEPKGGPPPRQPFRLARDEAFLCGLIGKLVQGVEEDAAKTIIEHVDEPGDTWIGYGFGRFVRFWEKRISARANNHFS